MIWPEWYRVSEGEGGCCFLFSAKTQTFVNEARAESELMLKKRGRGWERAGMELTILCVCVSEEEEEYQSGGRWDLKSSMRALWQRNLSIKSLQSTIIIITKKIKNKKYVGCVRRPAVMLVTDAPERTFLCRSVFLRRGQNQREIRPVWLKGGCVRREEAA